MNVIKVRTFKNQQLNLAKEISKKFGGVKFSVTYEQRIPSAFFVQELGRFMIGNSSQIIFPTKVVRKGYHRVIVVMQFEGVCKSRKLVGKILKRQFSITQYEDHFLVKSSFSPNNISES